MEFETVQIGNAFYVKKNGVMSMPFTQYIDGDWYIFVPVGDQKVKTKTQALRLVANQMDDWYTASQAAEVLVEMGVFDEAPSAQRITKWCRDGLLPGAIKVRALRGSGGAWRIPEAGLVKFAERRSRQ